MCVAETPGFTRAQRQAAQERDCGISVAGQSGLSSSLPVPSCSGQLPTLASSHIFYTHRMQKQHFPPGSLQIPPAWAHLLISVCLRFHLHKMGMVPHTEGVGLNKGVRGSLPFTWPQDIGHVSARCSFHCLCCVGHCLSCMASPPDQCESGGSPACPVPYYA